jgi:hypothetical protein
MGRYGDRPYVSAMGLRSHDSVETVTVPSRKLRPSVCKESPSIGRGFVITPHRGAILDQSSGRLAWIASQGRSFRRNLPRPGSQSESRTALHPSIGLNASFTRQSAARIASTSGVDWDCRRSRRASGGERRSMPKRLVRHSQST